MASPSGVLSTRPPSQYDAPPISTHGNCGARLPLARMCRGSIAQTWSASRFGGGLSLPSRGWGWFRKRVSTPETTSTAVTTKVVGLALRASKSTWRSQGREERARVVEVLPAGQGPHIHARRVEAGQAEEREIALHLRRQEGRRVEPQVLPELLQAPASVGAAVRADDAGGVDGADRDARDTLEDDLAPGCLGLVHQLEQRRHGAPLVGAERAAALQHEPDLDGFLLGLVMIRSAPQLVRPSPPAGSRRRSRLPASGMSRTSRVWPGSKRTAVPAGMSSRMPRALPRSKDSAGFVSKKW